MDKFVCAPLSGRRARRLSASAVFKDGQGFYRLQPARGCLGNGMLVEVLPPRGRCAFTVRQRTVRTTGWDHHGGVLTFQAAAPERDATAGFTMSTLSRFANKKTYALHRMTVALGRAISSSVASEKDRASRWAGAWGLLAGVRGRRVRLRATDLSGVDPTERRKTVRL